MKKSERRGCRNSKPVSVWCQGKQPCSTLPCLPVVLPAFQRVETQLSRVRRELLSVPLKKLTVSTELVDSNCEFDLTPTLTVKLFGFLKQPKHFWVFHRLSFLSRLLLSTSVSFSVFQAVRAETKTFVSLCQCREKHEVVTLLR